MLSLHLTTSSLIAVRGEGSEEPFLQGQGNERQSVTKLEGYVKGGLAPLHYGTIKYLPCYAAAGSRVTFGMFNDIGKVSFESIISEGAKYLWHAIPMTRILASCQLLLLARYR